VLRRLAQSENYIVEHECETVFLSSKNKRLLVIGDFYGDPEVAIIDRDEKWCAMGGCGVIVYWLEEPFSPYQYNVSAPQYFELHRTKSDIWWIEGIEQVEANEIEVRLAGEKTYRISFDRSKAEPIPRVTALV
jgi:hypothetical protein